MATWSKVKQQLEGFLSPGLVGRVEYRPTGYRYVHDKVGRSYITVDRNDVFNMCETKYDITWYKTETEIVKDPGLEVIITEEERIQFAKTMDQAIPQERLGVILEKRKRSDIAMSMMKEQVNLTKSDFFTVANEFLTSPIESSLESSNILLNVLAIVDRRVGKSRLRKMKPVIMMKHPIVRYFYDLRCEADGIYK